MAHKAFWRTPLASGSNQAHSEPLPVCHLQHFPGRPSHNRWGPVSSSAPLDSGAQGSARAARGLRKPWGHTQNAPVAHLPPGSWGRRPPVQHLPTVTTPSGSSAEETTQKRLPVLRKHIWSLLPVPGAELLEPFRESVFIHNKPLSRAPE